MVLNPSRPVYVRGSSRSGPNFQYPFLKKWVSRYIELLTQIRRKKTSMTCPFDELWS